MTAPGSPVTPDWLALREPADAAARAVELADRLSTWLRDRSGGPLVVRDLGCGTGSMGRWLAGRLPRRALKGSDLLRDAQAAPSPRWTDGPIQQRYRPVRPPCEDTTWTPLATAGALQHPPSPQHWLLHDRDPVLLDRAMAGLPAGITAEPRLGDLTALDAAQLAGTTLVTASALLDLLTADEVENLAAACAAAGCPALLTLSVTGSVLLTPADPLDSAFAAAFDAHQRRTVAGRRLLGPDAPTAAVAAFGRHGMAVVRAPSPWRLGPGDGALIEQWMRGWLAAACEHHPALASEADAYLRRRLEAAAHGGLRVVVGHADLLALPESQS